MASRFYFFVIILYFTAILISTVHLRSTNKHIFNKLCNYRAEQNQLRQELWQKQLQLEVLTNPAAISQRFDSDPNQ